MGLSRPEPNEWKQSHFQRFWREIAVDDHLVQMYENERTFLNTLEGFAGTGLLAGESVVIIATAAHIAELNERLIAQGFNVAALRKKGRYQDLDAADTLQKFMKGGTPDPKLFRATILPVHKKAAAVSERVRAFGEMVVLLWETGNGKGTLELEKLWNKFMAKHSLCLFCAYPRKLFGARGESISHICGCHTKVIAGWPHASTEVYFSEMA